MTINQALKSGATHWSDLRDLPQLEDQSRECLLATINKIKRQLLGCGHASKSTASNLVISTSLITISQDHFSLLTPKLNMRKNLLNWSFSLLPASATLDDFKKEA
ncbi:hypothetical protein PGTUg99_031960 [Puccinia graminis f. sp. tritici]|uniref:Uncharacterized protein n=1 Tax=Puccinia graminis f. sp. tritici TaxID=56615 RepID=A0A5B0QRA1_PUCGR|nr:hypothetical protein PGTUg99_031960 [Puccinia graminis f. sp. tritici]